MKLFDKILEFFNPQGIKCVVCGVDVDKNEHGICQKCKTHLPINGHVCQKCGVDIRTMNDFCDSCGKNQLAFDVARSVCRYEDVAKQLVLRLKFAGQKYLSKPMAQMMVEVLQRQNWVFDAVTYIPSSKDTIKNRGYNQAQLIANDICDIMSLKVVNLAQKVKDLPPQEKMDYHGRFDNMQGAFVLTQKPPKSLLVIDDVKTTGATLNEFAKIVKKHGCKQVYCLTFASSVKKVPTSQL